MMDVMVKNKQRTANANDINRAKRVLLMFKTSIVIKHGEPHQKQFSFKRNSSQPWWKNSA